MIKLVEHAMDDFGQPVYIYEDGAIIRTDSINGMWRLYNDANKNIDNDQYRHDLMQRNGYQLPN